MDARPLPSSPDPEMQAKNEGYRKLAVHLKDTTDERIAVLLTPLPEGTRAPDTTPAVKPLDEW